MGEGRDTFWNLERANRRKTVELVAIFILIYAVCGCALDLIFHTVRVANHQLTGVPWLTMTAVVFASAQALWAYYRGSSVIIGAVHGFELAPSSVKEQAVVDVVNEMALAAHIPVPRVCLMEDPAPNAFATGRDIDHSTICVTRGLVDQLDREELQGVIAHEMAHIRGHDTRITQMAAVMVGGFGLLSGFFIRGVASQRGGRATGFGTIAAVPGLGLVAIPVFILSTIGWIFSKVAAISLSREREYLADASSVEFTRNPSALIRALEHIARIESPLKASLRGVAPLFIVDPFECGGSSWSECLDEVARIGAQQDKTKQQRDAEVAAYVVKHMPQNPFQQALSSHPPIHDRIVRLQALLGDPSGAPAESPAEIRAKRSAAAKVVTEATETNPDAAAAVIEAMLRGAAGTNLVRVLGLTLPEGGSDMAERSEQNPPGQDPVGQDPTGHDPTYANPSDQTAYQKLYEYNLKYGSQSGQATESESLLRSLARGQPATIDPDQLRAALAVAMASAHKKSAAAPASTPGEHPPAKKPHILFWLVMALSAGAIVASLAIK